MLPVYSPAPTCPRSPRTVPRVSLQLLAVVFLAVGPAPAQPARPKVATHYYYWYRWPDEHFRGAGAHFHHLPQPERASYLDPAWHAGEFGAMAECGIDIALAVFWDVAAAPDRPDVRFSRAGLPPMVKALERLRAAGRATVQLGLMFDTSTLANRVRGVQPLDGRPDLRSAAGRALFCDTVLAFFARVPQRWWARVDGRPLVVLYTSAFAARWDRRLGPALREAFVRRFPGERPFLVAEQSWGDIGQDGTYGFGAALYGPVLHPGIAAIGPGFDDSVVPGRTAPRRDRDDGRFYRWSWRRAIESRPRLVVLETWNEMHEGSEICATKELGRRYLDITKEYTARLRAGDPGPEVALGFPTLWHRADRSWGQSARGASEVHADYRRLTPERFGLREVAVPHGPCRVWNGALRPYRAPPGGTFLCFQVTDHFMFEVDLELEVTVDLDWGGQRHITLEYDSRDRTAPQEGRYRSVRGTLTRHGMGQRLTFRLPRARCGNGQDAGTDFRLRIDEARTVVRRVGVRVVRGG
ncbi:MAG: DUF5010 domain-containing protein [Planctomycetes bacterium]|nr:DUF5010 domain-containing protein [Planctomycetota bacterium]